MKFKIRPYLKLKEQNTHAINEKKAIILLFNPVSLKSVQNVTLKAFLPRNCRQIESSKGNVWKQYDHNYMYHDYIP